MESTHPSKKEYMVALCPSCGTPRVVKYSQKSCVCANRRCNKRFYTSSATILFRGGMRESLEVVKRVKAVRRGYSSNLTLE